MTSRGPLLVHQPWGTLQVTGPDRVSWLNGLVTCDVSQVKAGRGQWGLVLTRTGKVLSDLNLLVVGERLLVATAEGRAGLLHETLDRMLIMEDAELEDVTPEHAWLGIYGPGALRLGERLATSQPDWALAEFAWIDEPAVALAGPRQQLLALDEKRLAAIEPAAVMATRVEWDRFRLEHNLPLYGVDFGDADNPHQAGLERRAVNWSKGCYLGQEVVCMQDMRGKLKRRLLPLSIDTTEPPAAKQTVLRRETGEPVGEITSAALDAERRRVVALAMIQLEKVGPAAGIAATAGNPGMLEVAGASANISADQTGE